MNTLLLSLSPLHIRSTPWAHKNSVLEHTLYVRRFPHNPFPSFHYRRRTLKLQAKAKGFGTKGTLPEKNLQEEDDDEKLSTRSKKEDDKIADEVWGRMIVRILAYVGIPMASGIALLVIFGFLKENHIWDVPLWLPFVTTLIGFGTSALGIAYGTLSTSLDPNKKGSLLGWEEVQQNWPELWKEDIE
ncbi:hypothetical protein C5167_020987 [Papaver somniferum]|uniref:Uncharacterized protein n=1 Tax=Papaver somniferum TaxID=3469 RepID=A0A4Y7IYJ0_PAPSO|nr:uncharacterized protein PAM68-like [Papaver somniferum]RZC52559.1 hypothetical protein C5167_020987 [Papaver somniferum]